MVIPCEGGLAYSFARKISTKRIFEKRYGQSFKWFIEREHLNKPVEIFEELKNYFKIIDKKYFPLLIKAQFCNLCICLKLTPLQ